MSGEDTSTRTIASVAAVVAILALALGLLDSMRTGLVAEYAGTANAVSQQNEQVLNDKVMALEARVAELEKAGAAEPAAEPAADPADAPAADPSGDAEPE